MKKMQEQIKKRIEQLKQASGKIDQQILQMDNQKNLLVQQILMNNGAIAELEKFLKANSAGE